MNTLPTAVVSTFSPPRNRGMGPAMRLALILARQRAEGPTSDIQLPFVSTRLPFTAVWELAERYHPEQVWLAQSCVRGERAIGEIKGPASCEGLAPDLVVALGAMGDCRV